MVEINFKVKVNPKIRSEMSPREKNQLAIAIIENFRKAFGTELFEIESVTTQINYD